MEVKNRISRLREIMQAKGLSAYIVPSSDPHLSEYLPDCWKTREWLSGFTGSAGTLVVTMKNAALWTDSRYFLQGEQELKSTDIALCKMGLPETPSMEAWLQSNLSKGEIVGFDGRLFAKGQAESIITEIEKRGLAVNPQIDIIDNLWIDRPSFPMGRAFEYELRYAGQSVSEKLQQIREELSNSSAHACVIAALDEVAWVFNIRGSDVEYNPVVMAYGYVSLSEAILFINLEKIDENLANVLKQQGVTLKPYDEIEKTLSAVSSSTKVMLDEARTNYRLSSLIPSSQTIKGLGIPTKLKAVKNDVEVENIRESHVKDGLAMCNFLYWLENEVESGKVTELTIAEKLREFRGQQEGFVSESFGTIAGYHDHGAIVHYSASPDSSYVIKPEGFLLVDSGGQYFQGTTDITRTIHLSTPTQEEKEDYTLVLKGMVRLSMAQFPVGTRGSQLDILAREAMWNRGVNYGHGTGHGIGAFLNVHEGPQSIRTNENPVTIEPGMIQSNEPGIYRAGKYGIRIENLIICNKSMVTDSGAFLNFETLTLCPIDTNPIDLEMLTKEELLWLNQYHTMVYEKLSPHMTSQLQAWLKEKTKAL